jgi:hypothetical protein
VDFGLETETAAFVGEGRGFEAWVVVGVRGMAGAGASLISTLF